VVVVVVVVSLEKHILKFKLAQLKCILSKIDSQDPKLTLALLS
jgi:hypothetical protein